MLHIIAKITLSFVLESKSYTQVTLEAYPEQLLITKDDQEGKQSVGYQWNTVGMDHSKAKVFEWLCGKDYIASFEEQRRVINLIDSLVEFRP